MTMTRRELPDPTNAEAITVKKAWVTPEIRDESVKNLTEAKVNTEEETDNYGPS